MKRITCLLSFLLAATVVQAQEPPRGNRTLPLTFSLFSESVSLPTFGGLLRSPNPGVRVGTELYYRNRPGSQVFQTVNLGYYYHKTLHHGLYLSSELGYRKFIGPFFLDGTVGAGYLHLVSRVPVYEPAGIAYTVIQNAGCVLPHNRRWAFWPAQWQCHPRRSQPPRCLSR